MNLYRLWHDTLGSAGGMRINPRLWREVLTKSPVRLIPFLYTQIIRGRVVNALSRQIRGKTMFVPKQIIIEPTYECNLQCPICYAENKPGLMKPELLETIIHEGRGIGINRYVFMGGEPTMKHSIAMIKPVIDTYKNCFFTFCTNGTLVDDTIIEEFKEKRHLSLIFSIDGPEEITDHLRGKGTFRRAMDNLDKAIENNINVAVSITTTPGRWREQLSSQFVRGLYDKGIFVIYTHFKVDKENPGLPHIDVIALMLHLQSLVTQFPVFLNEGYYGKLTPRGIVPRENHQIVIDPLGNVRPDRFDFDTDYGSLLHNTLQEILSNPELISCKRKSREEANDYLEYVKEELEKNNFRVFQPKILY
jgi:MoaA/NifB/PqqE/SkfB family radical SAM enzyme